MRDAFPFQRVRLSSYQYTPRTGLLLAVLAHCQTYGEFMVFIRLCNEAVIGVRASSLPAASTDAGRSATVDQIVGMLQQMADWVRDIPAIDEPMRFGNKAFR